MRSRRNSMSILRPVTAIPLILRAQYASRDKLDGQMTAGITAMLDYARRNVPAYRDERYLATIKELADLTQLPLLTKARVLESGVANFHSPDFSAGDCHLGRTSGTTSQVLEVRHDLKHNYAHDRAANVRRFFATGRYRPWHRLVHFKEGYVSVTWHERFKMFRRDQILMALPPQERVARLLSSPVQAIIGYPVMLRDLLRSLTDAQLTQLRTGLKVVFTESELLTAEIRAQLTEGFGVPIFNEYSAEEALHIAYECPGHQLHIAEDRVYVEVVDEAGQLVPDGVEGRVVVTPYRERAMPLPRYLLDDRAIRHCDPCTCGRTFRRLDLTRGRADDYIVLPDGERMYVGPFLAMATRTPGVAECMVRQDAAGKITVYLVADPRDERPFVELSAYAEKWLFSTAGRKLPITFEPGEQLEITARGKGRFLVSDYRP